MQPKWILFLKKKENKIKKEKTFVITCFLHYDIFAKPRSRMTTATTFPAKMTLVHAREL